MSAVRKFRRHLRRKAQSGFTETHRDLLTSAATIAILACVTLRSSAQLRYRLPPEDPLWLKLKITQASVGIYSEGVFEQAQFGGGGNSVDYSRIFIGPSLGLGLQGSFYHPNLAAFSLNSEMALGWANENVKSTTSFHRSELEELGNFQSSVYLLNNKPYASSLFANYDHTFRDYDFFNRTTVDSLRFGGQTGYREGPVPFTVSVWNLNEDEQTVIGFQSAGVTPAKTNLQSRPIFGTSNLKQTTVNFDAHNERENGSTRFNYGLTDYSRSDFGANGGETDHAFGLADSETWGRRRQILWNNELGYSMRRFTDAPSDDLNANSHLSIEHTPSISTFYDGNYYRSTFGPNESDNYDGSAAITHQLYESLRSTLRADGQQSDFDGPGGSGVTTRFGLSLSEAYTKRLNPSARLSVNGSLRYDHTEVTQSGSVITAIDEPHGFSTGSGGGPSDTFSLNHPNVDHATIIVTDSAHTLVYVQGLDYLVTRNGLLTFIQRMGGSRIPAGGSVLVTYNAKPSPSGSYDTINGLLQVRLEFWNGLLGIFGRVSSIQNSGTPGLIVQDLSAVTLGADTSWRWLRAGAEYEIYDSSFSSYRSARLFQSLSLRPDEASTLNLDFSESWTRYLDAAREEKMISFITRYHRRLTIHLGSDIEGGVSVRQGAGVDQTLAAVRPGLDFAMGKLSLKMGYDFEYESFLSAEERIKHMFFLRLKRIF